MGYGELGASGIGSNDCALKSNVKFGEKILKALADCGGELDSINARLNKLENNLLPPIPQSPCNTDKTPSAPTALMDGIFYSAVELKKRMQWTKEMLNRFENEL